MIILFWHHQKKLPR